MGQATIMDRYYDLISLSAIGQESGHKFEIASFKFGYGFVDESGDEPILLPVPSDTSAIGGVFFTGTPQLSYSNGRILLRCEMPKGSIPQGQVKHSSICGVFDKNDNLLCAMVSPPAWLTEDDLHVVESYIDNVLAGV